MTIPEYPGLMQPVLHTLSESRREMPFVPLMKEVGARLGLTREEVSRRLPSGSETVFANRLQWALAYLQSSGAVKERDGRYSPARAASETASDDARTVVKKASSAVATMSHDGIAAGAHTRERLTYDLLDLIHAEPPEFFECLVMELLLAMGYGRRQDLARHLGRSGDGGLDGAIPQDVLWLDVIYVQAKRYRPTSSVPVNAVREFAGSLDGRKANKGIFVTTAAFPRSAWTFVRAVPSKIVLIDGPALADLLIGYSIAVKVRESYEVRRVDETVWQRCTARL